VGIISYDETPTVATAFGHNLVLVGDVIFGRVGDLSSVRKGSVLGFNQFLDGFLVSGGPLVGANIVVTLVAPGAMPLFLAGPAGDFRVVGGRRVPCRSSAAVAILFESLALHGYTST